MSGGVDSSVAAWLLKEQGYECVGVFMWVGDPEARRPADPGEGVGTEERRHGGAEARTDAGTGEGQSIDPRVASPDAPLPVPRLKQGCCSVGDSCDARAVAGRLGIPFYTMDFHADFDRIIEYFVDEYARGRTPNPCIVCNSDLKFGKLLRYADAVGAEYIATGHYARVLERGGRTLLARSLNLDKDQSYALFGIRRENLARCRFPIGEIADKQQVRRIAAELGLEVHDKPESQEICFVPDDDYKRLVRDRRPETERPGEVRDSQGNVLGTHAGIVNYTIGQRRGLGIAAGTPIYVTGLDAASNTVTVGPRSELLSTGLLAEHVNWLTDPPAVGQWQPAAIKIRYQHTPTPGTIRRLESGDVEAHLDTPQPAVTPGQAAVFYAPDNVVLGGGWIVRAVRDRS